jgi:hypothetical protein
MTNLFKKIYVDSDVVAVCKQGAVFRDNVRNEIGIFSEMKIPLVIL